MIRGGRQRQVAVQCPKWVYKAVSGFKTVADLLKRVPIEPETAKKLIAGKPAKVTLNTICKLRKELLDDQMYSFKARIDAVMTNCHARRTYLKLVSNAAQAVMHAPGMLHFGPVSNTAYAYSETHKALFALRKAITDAGVLLWKIHENVPEYDVEFFGTSGFVEYWSNRLNKKEVEMPPAPTTEARTPAYMGLRYFNEHPELDQLTKRHKLDAGWDLRMCNESVTIEPHSSVLVETGVHVAIPKYYVGLIQSRSGNAVKHGIEVGAGVIDPNFRGPLKILLHNMSDKPVTFKKGDRVAQFVVVRCFTSDPVLAPSVEALGKTDRGDDGFGSTGIG